MGATVTQAEQRLGVAELFGAAVQRAGGIVGEWREQQRAAVVLEHQVVGGFKRALAARAGQVFDRLLDRRFVIGRVAQREHALVVVGFQIDAQERVVGRLGQDAPADVRIAHRRHHLGGFALAQREEGLRTVDRAAVGLQAEQHAHRARRHLGGDPGARLSLFVDAGQHLAEVLRLAMALRQRDRAGAAAGPRDPEHHAQLVALTVSHVGDDLQHAPAGVGQALRDAGQLVFGGLQRRGGLTLDAAVVHRARGREAKRAGAHGLAGQFAHLRDVLRIGRLQARGAFAHHVDAQRAVGQLRRDVDVARAGVQVVQILTEGLPLPLEAFVKRRAGNVFDAFHQLDQAVVIGGAHRGKADSAVAHHRGGHAVQAGGLHAVGPGGLAVVVGVDVDEARRDEFAAGVDLVGARAGELADRGNAAVADGDVAFAQVVAQAIGERAAANHQIECLGHAFSFE